MVDHCLSALATAWLITFVATTGLVTALAMESVWDREVYSQVLQDIVTQTRFRDSFIGGERVQRQRGGPSGVKRAMPIPEQKEQERAEIHHPL